MMSGGIPRPVSAGHRPDRDGDDGLRRLAGHPGRGRRGPDRDRIELCRLRHAALRVGDGARDNRGAAVADGGGDDRAALRPRRLSCDCRPRRSADAGGYCDATGCGPATMPTRSGSSPGATRWRRSTLSSRRCSRRRSLSCCRSRFASSFCRFNAVVLQAMRARYGPPSEEPPPQSEGGQRPRAGAGTSPHQCGRR